jgi:hypothetical protein
MRVSEPGAKRPPASRFAASSAWAQAAWTTPAVPASATALSFGLNIAATGSLTDDYAMIRSRRCTHPRRPPLRPPWVWLR